MIATEIAIAKEVSEAKAARFVTFGRRILEAEAEALIAAGRRLDTNLVKAIEIIEGHDGKVVVSGVGKSGRVAEKIAGTLSSTGTPAVYMHPTEAVHGDLGVYSPGDPTILVSKSGSTAELMRLIPTLRQFNSSLIAIVSNTNSQIASKAEAVLDATVAKEADRLGIVPTSSAIVAMALGDVLASALMELRGFKEKDFARFHPGGQLGRNLSLRVGEVMHKAEKIALVYERAKLKEIVTKMTKAPLGLACVVDEEGLLLGVITEGDIRRLLLNPEALDVICARDMMTRNPVKVYPEMSLAHAVKLMEDRPSQISVLPAVEPENNRLVGLIRLHDVYQPQFA